DEDSIRDRNVTVVQTCALPNLEGRLPITRGLFADDAVMTEGLPVRRATIGCTKNSRTVTMDFANFDYFAVWSANKDFDVSYVCRSVERRVGNTSTIQVSGR